VSARIGARGFPLPFATALAVGLLAGAAAVGGAFVLGPHDPPPVAPSCLAPNSHVADPTAVHGAFVLAPPLHSYNAYYADVQSYLVPNPTVCGADFWVPWAWVESGSLAHPVFNYTAVDTALAPWVAAGKEVNLIFEMVGEQAGQQYVPTFVLSAVPTLSCGSGFPYPVYWNTTYENAYRAFMAATVAHYDHTSGLGYIRFGLGIAGETQPILNIGAPGCQAALNASGFTIPTWTNYLTGMLAYEHSLSPEVQLMVALEPPYPNDADNVPQTVAAAAVQYGFGIGSEGLQLKNTQQVNATGVGCGGSGWCQLFSKYAGKVPLELQTSALSEPNGSGPTGSLVQLLPFGLSQHTQVFELYLDDWLTAFDPNYPAYAQYHLAYAEALTQTADVVGTGAT
jgi:hypothetical protein